MRSMIRSLAAGALAAAVSLGSIAPAVATGSVTDDSSAEIRAFWDHYGVAPEIQDALVAKLESNGSLDASSAYAEPVSVDTDTTASVTVTVETFADGSIRVSGIETAPGDDESTGGIGLLDAGVTDCKSTSGTGWVHYTGCRVFSANGTQNISFKVDYEKYSAGNAKIIRSYGAVSSSQYGSMTLPTRTLWRPQSSATQKAVAKYRSDYESHNGASSETIYLAFWLSSNGTRTVGLS